MESYIPEPIMKIENRIVELEAEKIKEKNRERYKKIEREMKRSKKVREILYLSWFYDNLAEYIANYRVSRIFKESYDVEQMKLIGEIEMTIEYHLRGRMKAKMRGLRARLSEINGNEIEKIEKEARWLKRRIRNRLRSLFSELSLLYSFPLNIYAPVPKIEYNKNRENLEKRVEVIKVLAKNY